MKEPLAAKSTDTLTCACHCRGLTLLQSDAPSLSPSMGSTHTACRSSAPPHRPPSPSHRSSRVGISLSWSRGHPRQPRSDEYRGAAPPQTGPPVWGFRCPRAELTPDNLAQMSKGGNTTIGCSSVTQARGHVLTVGREREMGVLVEENMGEDKIANR